MLSRHEWYDSETQAGAIPGLSKGKFVFGEEAPGRRCYLKPVQKVGLCVAAREKIASDLAQDLGVNVPPAILAERGEPDEPCACVTLVLHPQQLPWQYVDPAVGILPLGAEFIQAIRQAAATQGAAALAFDTWVEQPDHGEKLDNHNIVVGYDAANAPDSPEIVFLDYAFAFGAGDCWSAGQARCMPAVFPDYLSRRADAREMNEVVTRIEAYDVTTIQEIVGRIPDAWMSTVERDVIATTLIARRHMLRSALLTLPTEPL